MFCAPSASGFVAPDVVNRKREEFGPSIRQKETRANRSVGRRPTRGDDDKPLSDSSRRFLAESFSPRSSSPYVPSSARSCPVYSGGPKSCAPLGRDSRPTSKIRREKVNRMKNFRLADDALSRGSASNRTPRLQTCRVRANPARDVSRS